MLIFLSNSTQIFLKHFLRKLINLDQNGNFKLKTEALTVFTYYK